MKDVAGGEWAKFAHAPGEGSMWRFRIDGGRRTHVDEISCQ